MVQGVAVPLVGGATVGVADQESAEVECGAAAARSDELFAGVDVVRVEEKDGNGDRGTVAVGAACAVADSAPVSGGPL